MAASASSVTVTVNRCEVNTVSRFWILTAKLNKTQNRFAEALGWSEELGEIRGIYDPRVSMAKDFSTSPLSPISRARKTAAIATRKLDEMDREMKKKNNSSSMKTTTKKNKKKKNKATSRGRRNLGLPSK